MKCLLLVIIIVASFAAAAFADDSKEFWEAMKADNHVGIYLVGCYQSQRAHCLQTKNESISAGAPIEESGKTTPRSNPQCFPPPHKETKLFQETIRIIDLVYDYKKYKDVEAAAIALSYWQCINEEAVLTEETLRCLYETLDKSLLPLD